MVVLDPGHGLGNKSLGVFDPGIVGVDGARESDWALLYADRLRKKLIERQCGVALTRAGNGDECSLASRVATAKRLNAKLLLSIHFNGDAIPGNSAPDGQVKGAEALYGTPSSKRFADLITGAASYIMPTRVKTFRGNLYVLRYDPSVIVEVGFLDDPEDFALISDEAFIEKFCTDIAFTIAENVRVSP